MEPIDPLELPATVKALLRLSDREKENRRLIQQLSRSHRQFVEATNAAECGLWDWDIASGKLEWFGAHERLAGMLPGGFSGKIEVFSEILHPEDRTRVWNKLQGMMNTREEHFFDEYRFVHPDGSIHWMTAKGRFFYDDAGHAVRMAGVVQDITSRKQAEDQLAQYRAIIAAATDGIAQTDLTGRFLLVNDRYCEITGRSREALLSLRMQDITHLDDLPANLEKFQALAEDRGGNFVVEKRYLKPDGSIVWVHNEVSAIRDPTGHIRCITAVAADITESKYSEHFVRRITDVAPSILYVYDLEERRNVWGNREMFAGLGYSREQIEAIAGDLLRELLHPDDWRRYLHYAERLTRLVDGEVVEFEYRMRHADGSYRWLRSRDTVFRRADNGTVKQIAGSALDITDRRQAEDTLRLRDRALNASDAGVLIVDAAAADLPIIFASVGFERLTGYQPAEVLGRNCRFLQGPETDRTQVARIRAALEAGNPIRLVLRNYRQDGTGFWNDLSISPVHDLAGHLTHFVGIQNDVTTSVDMQHALRESEERLRLALDGADMGSWDVDLHTGEAIWNRRHAAMQGYEAADEPHTMQQWKDRVHPDDLDRVLATIEQAKQSRRPFTVEHRVCIPGSDEIRWLSLYGRFMCDETNQPVRFNGVSQDITERKRAETALRENEQRLRLATEAAAIGIWEWNVVTNEIRWDPQMFEIYGVDPTSDGMVVYSTWSDTVVSVDLPEQERVLWDTVRRKGHSSRKFRIKRKRDGACRYIEAVETVRTNAQGETEWVVGTNIDVTDRTLAEEQLHERNHQLDLLSRISQEVILGGKSERDLLEQTFTEMSRMIDMEMFYHYRPGEDPRLLRLDTFGGITEEERKLFEAMSIGELLCGRVAASRKPLIVEDLPNSRQKGSELLAAAEAKSYCGIPLMSGSEFQGTLAFVSRRRTHFHKSEIQTIQTICDQIATMLERARLLRELKDRESFYRQTVQSIPGMTFTNTPTVCAISSANNGRSSPAYRHPSTWDRGGSTSCTRTTENVPLLPGAQPWRVGVSTTWNIASVERMEAMNGLRCVAGPFETGAARLSSGLEQRSTLMHSNGPSKRCVRMRAGFATFWIARRPQSLSRIGMAAICS